MCLRRIAAPFPGRAMRAPTEWTQRLTRRVVAQASFSCRCAAIHLLAPYGEVLQSVPRPAIKQIFYQLSDPSSGMTAFMPVIATSIMESSGSNTVRCWIIRPGQRSAREMTLSERPA